MDSEGKLDNYIEENDIIKKIDELQKLQIEQDAKFQQLIHNHDDAKSELNRLTEIEKPNETAICQLSRAISEFRDEINQINSNIELLREGVSLSV